MRMLVLSLLMFVLALPAPAQKPSHSPLVTAEWLRQHANDPDVVILHVAFNRREYTSEHIPGARFVWWNWIVPSTPDFSSELPATDEAQALLRGLGVNSTSTIVVVFSRESLTSGTRPLYTLQYFGLGDRSYLLDGGMDAWKAAGGPVTTDVPVVTPGNVTLTMKPALLADAEFIRQHLDDPMVTIVDARSRVYYDGRPAGQPKAGHIKGAVSIPYSEVVDSLTRFKPVPELRMMFEEAGVKKGSTIVTYCHIGQQATVTLVAAQLLGYSVKMYDGSFQDWAYQDDSYPVVNPDSEN